MGKNVYLPSLLSPCNFLKMRRRILLIGLPAAVILAVAVILIVRAGDPLKFLKPDPGFREYINGYTSGVISTRSAIRIQLTQPYADSIMMSKKMDPALFRFDPGLEGELVWLDTRTLEFRPSAPMKQNTTYTGMFRLSDLMEVPQPFREFTFQFHTIRQDYVVTLSSPGLEGDNGMLYRVTGEVILADAAEFAQVKEMLEGEADGSRVEIKWPEQASGKRFNFRIDSLLRKKETTLLKIFHDGSPIGVKKDGTTEAPLPGTTEFSVVDVRAVNDPDPCAEITFSDLLNPEDDFDGLVRIGDLRNLRFRVEGNRLRVFPSYNPPSEDITLVVEGGIKNLAGKTLGKMFSRLINFSSMKPAIKLVGEGTILPSTNGMLFPFDAVHLSAVDVKIQKIYEKNVPQFLQVNDLAGSEEMYRVATTVFKKKVDLRMTTQSVADFSQWNRYALDLTKFITPERGAIYRVILSFKREYSTYPCAGSEQPDTEGLTRLEEPEDEELSEDESWDYSGYYDYDWYDYEDYDWSERENPCNGSYYRYNAQAKNILSSDIGLLAKAGSDGKLICFTTDLITAQPLPGLELEVMDYRMQILGKGVADQDGKVEFVLHKKPFLVVARRGEERGYLKLGDGNSLSMSLFDVDGEQVKRGIKGFLYAERSVWRPGDTMYIHFILENKQKQLPENIPVMFELSDPQGNVIRRKISTSSVKGIYPFPVWTEESSVTGNYLGKVTLGNITYTKYFKVETVKPNRLKIEMKFPGDRLTASGDQKGKLEVRWLHGAMAPGLKADVTMTLERGNTRFTGFEGYTFDNPTVSFFSETNTIFEGALDGAGKADIEPSIELDEGAPGVMRATFRTKVFENGGDFSINTTTIPYYPYTSYAGLWVPKGTGWWDMLESGRQHQFRVAQVSSDGKGLSSKVKVEIFRIDWNWWWHNTERDLPYFLSNSQAVPVFSSTVGVTGGRGLFSWGTGKEEWGRYFIRVTDPLSGHTTGKMLYFDYPGWGRRSGQGREGASMLTISVDKPRYQTGETVHVTIPSSPAGKALVSIENGTGVMKTEWIKTDSGTTRYSFVVTPEMSPNVYVHITLLQPHSQTLNDMPIRMYGVVPVMVENSGSRLKPEISMPASWESGAEVSVTVKESQGKPMAYTLAIVDEGLLDLTNFKTPDPWTYFYGKEALGVKSWDLFSEVIGAWTGGFPRLLAIGGGDAQINYDKQKTRRFTPVVKVFGPVFLEAGKRQTHTFKMPQYVGSVRVMVVAAYDGAYGNAEKTAEVKSPLMVLGTLPRVAGPGETVSLPVNVFAMEKEIREVKVTVTPGGLFELQSAGTQTLNFSAVGDQVTHFNLKVKNQVGKASVDIVATSGSKSARHTIHLEVRNPSLPEVQVKEFTIAPGQSLTEELAFSGIAGTATADVEFSTIPSLNLGQRLDYLIRYPHGCLEQTVSAAFPQLLLKDVVYLDQRSQRQTDDHVKAALQKLISFVQDDGSFAYWPNSTYRNDWANTWTGHFIIEAERRGFVLPQGMKRNWISAQRRIVNSWQQSISYRQDDLMQAYRLYTLALAGAPEMGAMNRLKSLVKLNPQARWRLAAAYALAGKVKTAQGLIQGLPTTVAPYYEYGYTFGSPLRDRAMAAETMVLLRNYNGAFTEVKEIVKQLNQDAYYNTQATAYAFVAISSYYKNQPGSSGISCNWQYHGKSFDIKTDKAVSRTPLEGFSATPSGKLLVKNTGKSPLTLKVTVRGVPLPGTETPSNKKITMKMEYLTMAGQPLNPGKITQGTDFMAKVTLTNTTAENMQELALSQIFPSGWQIHNNRLSGVADARAGADAPMNYQDIRDDRVLTYFNLAPGKSKTFTVMLNATYTGRFYLPSCHCEAMYVPDAFARSAGQWVEVVK